MTILSLRPNSSVFVIPAEFVIFVIPADFVSFSAFTPISSAFVADDILSLLPNSSPCADFVVVLVINGRNVAAAMWNCRLVAHEAAVVVVHVAGEGERLGPGGWRIEAGS